MSEPESFHIKSPDCPACGGPPLWAGVTPFFCKNDECHILSWDPRRPLARLHSSTAKMIELDEAK